MSARAGIGVLVVLVACAVALLAPVLAPHDPTRSSVFFLQGPSYAHLFGTDELGRDILSRVIYGTRTSLAIGVGAALLAVIIGAPIGLAAGYLGGRLDIAVVQLIDLFIALPGLVLALIITVMVGPSLQNLVLVLGFVMWPVVARLIRGQTLAVREHAYIEAAVAAGGSSLWIIRRHVWPNIFRIVAAQFAVTVSFAIITSASLSFLGLGIPPPVPDWGSMVRSGFDVLAINPALSLAPGGAIATLVLGFYLMGKLRQMTRTGEPILRVEELSVSFTAQGRTIRALNGVSFDLHRGETLAIVGESGSGKSTTGLAVMGLVDRVRGTSISGAVHLARKDGTRQDILGLDDRALRKVRGNDVAMIFQEPMSSLNPVYTVGAQVIEALRQHQALDARAARHKACDLLAELGIANPAECLARYPHQLSGGMRQRVMIAIALSGDPQILIADEPTTALDVTIQAQILALLRRLQQRSGMSIIFITHNLGVVGEIAERAIVMYAGEVTEQLPVASLFDGARMPYTMALLRSVPRLGGRQGPLAAISGAPPSMSAQLAGCAFHPRCEHRIDVCDAEHPRLDVIARDHAVRCHRWRELAEAVT